MSIPKIIHYCWFGNGPEGPLTAKCIESWKKFCPDYEIRRWDENSFNLDTVRYTREAYEARKYAFVSDYVRLWALYRYGGIYLDTDVELVRPIDELLEYPGFVGLEYSAQTPYGRKLLVNTGSGVGAEAGNGIIRMMMDTYDVHGFIKDTGDLDMTPCTHRVTPSFSRIGLHQKNELQFLDGCAILPTDYLAPLDFMTGKLNVTENTYGIHYYNNSWGKTGKLLRIKSRLKSTKLGMYILRIKYCGRKKLRDLARSARNYLKLRHRQLFSCRNLRFGKNILFDRELKLRLGPGSKVDIGDRVESDGRLSIVTAHYGKLSIGNDVYFNDGVMISCLGRIDIGDGTLFGPGVTIFDNNHYFSPGGVNRDCVEGCIRIGAGCWIASNAVILKGADIGDNSVIGAGCVIKEIIPAGSIVTVHQEKSVKVIEERNLGY